MPVMMDEYSYAMFYPKTINTNTYLSIYMYDINFYSTLGIRLFIV